MGAILSFVALWMWLRQSFVTHHLHVLTSSDSEPSSPTVVGHHFIIHLL